MKLDQLFFQRQKGHSPSASMSRMSSPTLAQSTFSSSSQHDVSSMADQLNTISTTTTSVLTTLQTLMRRSKDNASELDNLKKQVLESKERDTHTVDEIKRILSSANSNTDLSALYSKLDSLKPAPAPAAPPPERAHKLEEEKAAVDNILANANQALTHLLTLTESINNLTSHINNVSTRYTTEESKLEALQVRKSQLEAEVARLEATIHLRDLELTAFTKKTEILESRILRAKTAVQVSGSKHIKMKKSPLLIGSSKAPSVQRESKEAVSITPQRRILSMSSTNKGSPRTMTEVPGQRKTSWSKKLGGMLSGLTSSNKENVATGMERVEKKSYRGVENDVLGLSVPIARGRSVSERTS